MQYNGRVHVWVKKEDRDLWNAIVDKPAWLHAHLNGECSIESIVELADELHQIDPAFVSGEQLRKEQK